MLLVTISQRRESEMGFVAIADTAKVELVGIDSASGQEIVNVMHAKVGSAPTGTYLLQVANVYETYYASIITGIGPSSLTGQRVVVTDLNTIGGPQVTVFMSGVTGSGTTGATGAAALLKLTTAVRGRSFRGRAFVGPLTSAAVNGDRISSGTIAAIGTAFGTLQTSLAALTPGSAVRVASRKLGTGNDVTGFGVEILPAYQRRRGAR
jgi:hypothetical protein